jgi:hypothetical protein
MRHLKIVTTVASLALATVLFGCGGGGSSNNSSSSTTATTAPTPTSVAYAEQNALPLAVAAKVPSGLKCASADVVWANMHTKAFHDPGDPYYGKTKNGAYMCRATAEAQGYHMAGARHTHMGTNRMNQMNASPAPATSGY